MHLAEPIAPHRSNRAFWSQVAAAVVLVVAVVVQVSTLRGFVSWFAVLALIVSVLAAVLCALCAVVTWRETHHDELRPHH